MASKSPTKQWFSSPENDAHKMVAQTIQFIKQQQSVQRRDMIHYLELYAAGNVAGLGTVLPADRLENYLYGLGATGDTRFNMAAAIVDTAVSMIGSTPAIPIYLTTGADFGMIRKAEKRSKVLQGQMNSLTGDLTQDWLLDACKTGTGVLHTYRDEDGCTAVERVHPLEILVEHADGLYQAPRSMHRVRLVSKEVLKAKFPEHASIIDMCAGPSSDAVNDFFLRQTGGDRTLLCEVWESHHLAPKKGKEGGRHTICIANATLLDEGYEHDQHPYTILRYRKRDFGFFGAGLIESCRAAQNRVNDLIWRVTRAQDLGSNLVVLNPNGENSVKAEQITNELGLVLNYDPLVGPPQLVKWEGTLGDLQEQIDLEFQRALAVEGLSNEQVNGEGAGRGLTSGVAVRAADDVQSRRLVQQIKRFQTACIALARSIERCNDEAAENDKDYHVNSRRVG
jgi:hypothetical protein